MVHASYNAITEHDTKVFTHIHICIITYMGTFKLISYSAIVQCEAHKIKII